MKITLNNFSKNPIDALRTCGYRYDGPDEKTGELRFFRAFSSNPFPRFHIYAAINKSNKQFNATIHLDQKKPVYEGTAAHSGEYEGPLIEKEVERIQLLLGKAASLEPKIESPDF